MDPLAIYDFRTLKDVLIMAHGGIVMQMVLCIIELKECVIKHIDTINTHILEILC